MDVDRELLEWLANGEKGLSSETMAFAALGIIKRGFGGSRYIDYPRDPSDLRRCTKLVAAVPWVLGEADSLLREQSAVWAELLDDWGYLTALLEMEAPSGMAPLTWKAMKAAVDRAERPAVKASEEA